MTEGLSGRLTDDGHLLPVRIYFEDTDFSGVVYHARYLHFFERGRSDFLRLKGVHHKDLENGTYGEPLFFVVRSMMLDFIAAAEIDDIVHVKTTIQELRGVRIVMRQTLLRGDDIIAAADVIVVLINRDKKPKKLPKALVDALS